MYLMWYSKQVQVPEQSAQQNEVWTLLFLRFLSLTWRCYVAYDNDALSFPDRKIFQGVVIVVSGWSIAICVVPKLCISMFNVQTWKHQTQCCWFIAIVIVMIRNYKYLLWVHHETIDARLNSIYHWTCVFHYKRLQQVVIYLLG